MSSSVVTSAPPARTLQRIRLLLALFAAGLLLSGLTAFPLEGEIDLIERSLAAMGAQQSAPALYQWIRFVHEGLTRTYPNYPFFAYGTDWLGFAHFVIALAFWGPYRDPVRNRWVVEWGIMACVLVLPLALICGPLRGVPFYWRLFDCSFGLVGLVLLWQVRKLTDSLSPGLG